MKYYAIIKYWVAKIKQDYILNCYILKSVKIIHACFKITIITMFKQGHNQPPLRCISLLFRILHEPPSAFGTKIPLSPWSQACLCGSCLPAVIPLLLSHYAPTTLASILVQSVKPFSTSDSALGLSSAWNVPSSRGWLFLTFQVPTNVTSHDYLSVASSSYYSLFPLLPQCFYLS